LRSPQMSYDLPTTVGCTRHRLYIVALPFTIAHAGAKRKEDCCDSRRADTPGMQSVLAFFQLRSWGTERRMLATRETWKGAHMARVRSLEREDLPAEHRHIYDDIARSRGRV